MFGWMRRKGFVSEELGNAVDDAERHAAECRSRLMVKLQEDEARAFQEIRKREKDALARIEREAERELCARLAEAYVHNEHPTSIKRHDFYEFAKFLRGA